MDRRKCRLWWPEQFSYRNPSSGLLLFGWFVDSVDSVDIVVAAAVSPSEISLHLRRSDLQEILHSTNKKMPMSLQESTKFSLLGHCATDCNNKDLKMLGNHKNDPPLKSISEQLQCLGVEPNPANAISCDSVNQQCNQGSTAEETLAGNFVKWNCGCEKLDKFIEPHRESLIKYSNWIQLLCKSQRILSKETKWIPELHHMHLNGHILPTCDVHLIIYDLPTYGRHHFALSSWSFSKQLGITFQKPNWVDELHKKPMLPDLDRVVLALNCASAAKIYIEISLGAKSPVIHFPCKSMLASMVWHTMAVFVASVSTVIYIIIQFSHSFLRYGSQTFFMMLPNIFRHTWKNVHIRCCQFMYWPIFLQDCGFSSQSNVEYAHRAAVQKHLIWSSVSMDVLLGIILGVALLANLDGVCFWVLFLVRYVTDNLLRSGCVWLMDVPAGFKLNTELAELLGMISLNAVQVFSTLWFFMASLLRYFIEGLAFAGILLGLTVPAALCIDMLKLSTLHVLTLHWLISLLYSQQIQALASLWRLFRGRKWNPLRQRLDSYDHTVEQHVVGSLLFTPLLLLLPTTSVFYIFFTSLNTTISFICITIETTISILHATPYAEILLWITRRRRFPSGIWIEIISCPAVSNSISYGSSGEGYLPSNLDQRKTGYFVHNGPESVVSLLCSNYATIGQIIVPYYGNVFHGVSSSFATSWAYGVLSGQRIPYTLQTRLPPTMPWMHISFREYWRLCHSSVLACRS